MMGKAYENSLRGEKTEMSLAKRIQDERKRAGLTLDQLAEKSDISKTYLWELEQDETGQKKPSADVLLKIANALSVTISDLLGLPSVQVKSTSVTLPSSLIAFRDQQTKLGNKLSDQDLRELATMRFRGAQPRTVDDWTALYLAFLRTSTKRK
jgi:transcriptional regulator with XRE-family HTH domain